MKKMILFLIATAMTIFSANAQINLDSVKVDSVINITESSAIYVFHIYGMTGVGFRQICDGLTPNYNTTCSPATLTNPVADTVIYINRSGLLPSTTYSYQAKILPGTSSGTSLVGSFTTLACPFSPSISGTNSICSGASTTLTASPSGGTVYTWKRNGTVVGSGLTIVASLPGNYTVDITFGGCTSTSSIFILN